MRFTTEWARARNNIRRFLLHTPPPKFRKIRYYGFLAACHRRKRLRLCRELLGMFAPPPCLRTN